MLTTLDNIQRADSSALKSLYNSAGRKTISTIIHEIRNPLTAINLANEALKEIHETGASDDEAKLPLMQIISTNVLRIEGLLQQLLRDPSEPGSFSKIDLYDILEDCLSRSQDRFFLKGIEIDKTICPGNLVFGNTEKLVLAFLNIIINAVEAIHSQNGKLRVELFTLAGETAVAIRDNGIGMSPEVVNRIFDPHFTCKPEGLGMGLANVKEIFDWHGASISVSSWPNEGTCFTIVFASAEK